MALGDRHVMLALGNLMAESREHLLAEAGSELRPSHHRVIGHVPPEGITVTELAERVADTRLIDAGTTRTTAANATAPITGRLSGPASERGLPGLCRSPHARRAADLGGLP